MKVNRFIDGNPLLFYTSNSKSNSCSCIPTTTKQTKTEVNSLKGTEKTIALLKAKPFKLFLSKWVLDDHYVVVPVAGRTRPLYISVKMLSEMTGIERPALQSFNEQTLVQVMHALSACRSFHQAKGDPSQLKGQLLDLFCALPVGKQRTFLDWLKDPGNRWLIDQIHQAIEDKTILPWNEILEDPELMEFLDVVLQSDGEHLILQNDDLQNLVRTLPVRQQSLLIDQLKQNPEFTSDFITQLVEWDQIPCPRFQMQQSSGNTGLDQKVQTLADFLYKEEIPPHIGGPILLSLLCEPDLNLEAQFPLLKGIKGNIYINFADLFGLIDLVSIEPRVTTQLMDAHFLPLLKAHTHILVDTFRLLQQNGLLEAFCARPAEKAFSFLRWLQDPRNQVVINQIHQAIEDKTALPWDEILQNQELIEFLDAVPSLSNADRWILQNKDVHDLMGTLPPKQQSLLADRLKKDFTFTSDFLVQLTQWMQNPSARFQVRQPSENAEFNQKLRRLTDLFDQEKMPPQIATLILLSFVCQPDQDLEVLFPLLKSLKENIYMRAEDIFNLVDLVHIEPRIKVQLKDSHFLNALQIDPARLLINLLFIERNGLLDIFCALHAEKVPSFLYWLSFIKNQALIGEIRQAIQDKQPLPWGRIDKDNKLVGFLEEALPSESERWMLKNKSVRDFVRVLPNKQQNLVAEQLRQNFKFTSDFLVQLVQWKQDPSVRLQVQPSGNAEFDQKVQALADFFDQEKIPANIALPLLISVLCRPNLDLEALYPLLKSIKTSKENINADHLLYLVHAEPQVKAQLNRPHFLNLLQQGKVNVNMLVGALKKVDEKLKRLPSGERHYEKKKSNKHYGFTIDEKGNYFIRTYPLGRGNFKKAAKAVSNIEQDIIVLSFTAKRCHQSQPIKELEKEEKILNRRLQNSMPPFISTQVASNQAQPQPLDKFFAVQVEMSGDGERLIKGPPKQILYVMTDIVQALVALHQSGSFHSDVKPGNFLFKGDPTNPNQPIKGYLHDFGLANDVKNPQTGGSLNYVPPETMTFLGQADSRKADVYAVGVSLIKMLMDVEDLNGVNSFYKAYDQRELNFFIESQFANLNMSQFSDEEKNIVADLVKVAKQLTTLDHTNRPSCQEALAKLEELKGKYPFPIPSVPSERV